MNRSGRTAAHRTRRNTGAVVAGGTVKGAGVVWVLNSRESWSAASWTCVLSSKVEGLVGGLNRFA